MEETCAALRQRCLEARRKLSGAARAAHSRKICDALTALPALRRAGVLFSYQALWDEADLSAFHRWAEAEGKTLAFPVTGPGGAMEAWAPQSPDAWGTDRFGIRAPLPEASRRLDPAELEAVLTPCVAFDGAGRRLGHGGGYYDRFLPRCPQALRIAVAFEAQRCPALRPAPWDVPMDLLATENGVAPAAGVPRRPFFLL